VFIDSDSSGVVFIDPKSSTKGDGGSQCGSGRALPQVVQVITESLHFAHCDLGILFSSIIVVVVVNLPDF
jgi:hypothetical protein